MTNSGAPAKPRDRRRQAMIWMLHETGMTWREIARAFGISESRAAELGKSYERTLERRMKIAYHVEPWAVRLRAAGAIRRG